MTSIPHDLSTPLRSVTQRITATPFKQLPYIAPYLATTIAEHGKRLFEFPKESLNGDRSDITVLVHKFKTQLSALLQDKSPEARYGSVVLIKATIEVGGWNILQSSGPWVRGLISILGRPDPSGIKTICVIVLTRIFLLTHEHQSLVREITTPCLSSFIAACLNLVRPSSQQQCVQKFASQGPFVLVILQALNELIALHPTSFRPFVAQLRTVVLPNIAPTPSSPLEDHHIDWIPEPVCQNAQRLFVLLHVCGPKNTAGDEWTRSLDTVILSIHRTADKVFRALIEDWRSASVNNNIPSSDLLEGVVSDQRPTPLALPPWLGIFAGIERLDSLLHTVHAFLASATSAAIVLPLGSILDLSDRIISALPPSKDKNVRTRPEIGRDEREGLWLGLPKLHISALGILSLTISRLGCGFVPAAYSVLDQVLWLLECEHVQSSVRMTCYGLVSQILTAFGLSLPRSCALSLSRCIKLCCEDLLPSNDLLLQNRGALVSDGKNIGNRTASATNADLYLKGANTHTRPSDAPAEVVEAARKLLSLTLTHLPNGYLAFSLRSQIDRTAILTNNKDAMLASVMNPVTKKNGKVQVVSILPFLARVYPRSLEVESLLRPQMPVVQPRLNELGDDLSEEDDKLYMHERPTNGMPTEIGSYGAGATDSRSAQQDTITSGYEDALSPAKSMVEAIVPCTRLSDRADVITMESTEANLSASTKRAREDSPKSVTQHLAASTMENQQAMGVGGNKRLRIAPNETEQTDSENHLPTDIPGIDRQDGESAALEPPMTEVFNTVSSRPALQQQGSDESDFEMPILDLEPGSDEEDEEEIDQEDDDDD